MSKALKVKKNGLNIKIVSFIGFRNSFCLKNFFHANFSEVGLEIQGPKPRSSQKEFTET